MLHTSVPTLSPLTRIRAISNSDQYVDVVNGTAAAAIQAANNNEGSPSFQRRSLARQLQQQGRNSPQSSSLSSHIHGTSEYDRCLSPLQQLSRRSSPLVAYRSSLLIDSANLQSHNSLALKSSSLVHLNSDPPRSPPSCCLSAGPSVESDSDCTTGTVTGGDIPFISTDDDSAHFLRPASPKQPLFTRSATAPDWPQLYQDEADANAASRTSPESTTASATVAANALLAKQSNGAMGEGNRSAIDAPTFILPVAPPTFASQSYAPHSHSGYVGARFPAFDFNGPPGHTTVPIGMMEFDCSRVQLPPSTIVDSTMSPSFFVPTLPAHLQSDVTEDDGANAATSLSLPPPPPLANQDTLQVKHTATHQFDLQQIDTMETMLHPASQQVHHQSFVNLHASPRLGLRSGLANPFAPTHFASACPPSLLTSSSPRTRVSQLRLEGMNGSGSHHKTSPQLNLSADAANTTLKHASPRTAATPPPAHSQLGLLFGSSRTSACPTSPQVCVRRSSGGMLFGVAAVPSSRAATTTLREFDDDASSVNETSITRSSDHSNMWTPPTPCSMSIERSDESSVASVSSMNSNYIDRNPLSEEMGSRSLQLPCAPSFEWRSTYEQPTTEQY